MKEVKKINFIVVPDGLAANEENETIPEPSFVYKFVLNILAKISKDNDKIWLAPANKFGCDCTEQKAGATYLKKIGTAGEIIYFEVNNDNYIDTRGNAKLLRRHLEKLELWPLDNAILVAYSVHMPRSRLAFKQEGFFFEALISVNKNSSFSEKKIVKRLFYYKYKTLHCLYELLLIFIYLIKLK
tara:strand:+ start:20471 stop:21025 length:555 start_codon:yes stop_codon:yes gene_type:complete